MPRHNSWLSAQNVESQILDCWDWELRWNRWTIFCAPYFTRDLRSFVQQSRYFQEPKDLRGWRTIPTLFRLYHSNANFRTRFCFAMPYICNLHSTDEGNRVFCFYWLGHFRSRQRSCKKSRFPLHGGSGKSMKHKEKHDMVTGELQWESIHIYKRRLEDFGVTSGVIHFPQFNWHGLGITPEAHKDHQPHSTEFEFCSRLSVLGGFTSSWMLEWIQRVLPSGTWVLEMYSITHTHPPQPVSAYPICQSSSGANQALQSVFPMEKWVQPWRYHDQCFRSWGFEPTSKYIRGSTTLKEYPNEISQNSSIRYLFSIQSWVRKLSLTNSHGCPSNMFEHPWVCVNFVRFVITMRAGIKSRLPYHLIDKCHEDDPANRDNLTASNIQKSRALWARLKKTDDQMRSLHMCVGSA